MSARSVARARRLAAPACAALVALGLAACGKTNDPTSAENNGVYVNAGPMTYQVEVSRELNQYAAEDSQYVRGLPAGTSATLTPNQIWYGVFLWAKNQTNRRQTTAANIDIIDTEGNRYYPVPLSNSNNAYAWTAEGLAPGSTEPLPDTTASFGPTQGALLLFKLNMSVYDNRPLMLEIYPPGGGKPATISLDL